MTFADLRLAEPLLRAVTAEGYSIPTPIQTQAIPHVLAGRDLLGCAQTGTGKTAAFALPMLQRLAQNPSAGPGMIRALILSPTRELAAQIGDSFHTYGRHTGLRHTVIFGGVRENPQISALRKGVDIVIATPGRLLDLMERGFVDLRSVQVFVLDEADRMLDMGFIPDVRRIAGRLPARRQTLLFSATMPPEVRRLAATLTASPIEVRVASASPAADNVEQFVYFVAKCDKPMLLRRLLQTSPMPRTLVFTRTKHGADRVVKQLRASGVRAEAIHGGKKQSVRQRALQGFKSPQPPVLVATDIASRGIDIDDISHVVNYDIPGEPETYVHRIGRTGRAGASGVAFSFCDTEERPSLKAIERLIRQAIPVRSHQAQRPPQDAPPAMRLPAVQFQPHKAAHSPKHASHHHPARQSTGAAVAVQHRSSAPAHRPGPAPAPWIKRHRHPISNARHPRF